MTIEPLVVRRAAARPARATSGRTFSMTRCPLITLERGMRTRRLGQNIGSAGRGHGPDDGKTG